MKKFSEWIQDVNKMDPGGETPLAMNHGQNVQEIGGLKQSLKTLIGQRLFDKLTGVNLPPQVAVELLQNIIDEFRTEFGLNNSRIRQAVKPPQAPPAADPGPVTPSQPQAI